MTALARTAAIVRGDVLIRMRRVSTVVIFLLLSWMAYLWVPAPSTGRTLMQVGGQRVIYNSAAVALGTASLATLFIGLIGFYVVSNALKRDLETRCGFVVASTTVRSSEYLLAKFAGNLAFLALFTAGFMVVAMTMVGIRGEGTVEPLVFLRHYAFLVAPALVATSALAVLFESVPWLSGRFGDVAYFFVWLSLLGLAAQVPSRGGDASTAALFDLAGFAVVSAQLTETYGTSAVGIGSMPYDAAKGTFLFEGLRFTRDLVAWRGVAALAPLALLPPALLFFRRFDPARVRKGGRRAKWDLLARLERKLKWATAPAVALAPHGTSLASAAVNDAVLSLQLHPSLAIAAAAFAVAALAMGDPSRIRSGLLPIAVAVLGAAIADVAARDARGGTRPLLFAIPGIRERFVLWKLASTLVLSAILLGAPLAVVAARSPAEAPAVAAGLLFLAGAATFLGAVSSNPKTFVVLFLIFWYAVVNDSGNTPAFDFANFYDSSSAAASAAWAAAGIALAAVAHAWSRVQVAGSR